VKRISHKLEIRNKYKLPKYKGSKTSILDFGLTNMRLLALSPCGLATYDLQAEMSSSPPTGKGASYWRFMFACWQTYAYYTILSNISQKKTAKKALFIGRPFSIEIRTLSCTITLKHADFLASMEDAVWSSVWFEKERGK